jgi:transcriptional regulator with XRE-family HTH domain
LEKKLWNVGNISLYNWNDREIDWKWLTDMARTNIKPVNEASAKLGAYLQQLRLERRLTMRGLAARAKVDFSYVSRLEHGLVGAPTARQLWKIARALDIEVADLYSEAGFVDAHGLPGFGPYLRTKYHLPDEAISQLQAHFALINEKYHAARNGDAAINAEEAPDA